MTTIIWDVDDVLNDLMRAWFEEWTASNRTARTLSYEQLECNPPHELLGISRAGYLASLDEFRLSGRAAKMQPVREVYDWFRRLGDHFHHMALTAVPLKAAHVSAEWVMRNFGPWIRSFSVVPSPRSGTEAPQYHATKTEFLGWWGKGDILVDDNEENVAGALSLGMKAVLVPRPWNRSGLTMTQALEELADIATNSSTGRRQEVHTI